MAIKRNGYIFMAVAAAVVFVLDQLTKLWVTSAMEPGDMVPVVDGFARLRYTQNSGAAFGIFPDASGIISVLAMLIIIAILVAFVRLGHPGTLSVLAAGLVVGGALGNLTDRLRLGSVVDFVDVYGPQIQIGDRIYTWPVFNVADSAITVGVILVMAGILFMGEVHEQKADVPATVPPAGAPAEEREA
jgi:signal peptidase II